MSRQSRQHPRIAIIGGGFAGASVAWNLAEAGIWADITVIDPAAELGRGLAFSTREPAHRINIPASQMSLRPESPADFINWLEHNELIGPDDLARDGEVFVQRGLFGRYVAEHLTPYLRDGTIRHSRARLVNVTPTRGYDPALRLTLSNGGSELADIVVLATGNPMPEIPPQLQPLVGSERLIVDPYNPARLNGIRRSERVLVVGSGLTAADVVATLDQHGHTGPILALARRGLRSLPYGGVGSIRDLSFASPAPKGTLALFRRVRQAAAEAAGRGQGWQLVANRLREEGQTIWAALDRTERARFIRHVKVIWEVHRHRVAPQVSAVLETRRAEGALEFAAARLSRVAEDLEGVHVGIRGRGEALNTSRIFDRVIVATGPALARCIDFNRGLTALADLGLIGPDPLGLGLATHSRHLARRRDSDLPGEIFVAGSLARGEAGELTGVPEIAAHSREIATEIVSRLSDKPKPVLSARRGKPASRPGARI